MGNQFGVSLVRFSLRPVDSCLFQARRSLRHQDEILRDGFAADDVCRFLVGEESDAARCHHLGGPRLQVSASLDAVGRPAVNRNVGGSNPPRGANSLGSSPDTWVT